MASKRKSEKVELPPGVQMSKAAHSVIEDRRQMLIDTVTDFQRAGFSAMGVAVVHGGVLTAVRLPDNATALGMLLGLVKTVASMAEKHDDKFTVGVMNAMATTLAEAAAFLEAKREGSNLQ